MRASFSTCRDRKEADIVNIIILIIQPTSQSTFSAAAPFPAKHKSREPISRAYCPGSCCYILDVSSLRTVVHMLCEGWEEAHFVCSAQLCREQYSLMIKSTDSEVRQLACESQLWPLITSMILAKLINFSTPQFCNLQCGADDGAQLVDFCEDEIT